MRSTRSIRRRRVAAVVATLAVVAVFVVRLVDIQLVQADELNTQSAGKRSVATTVYGRRGDIVDANGVVLAGSIMRYDITASPRNSVLYTENWTVQDRAAAIGDLAAAIGMPASEITAKIDGALAEDPKSDYVLLAGKVTLEVRNAVRALGLTSWIYPRAHPGRTYPRGAVGGSLVGFLGTDGPQFGLELSENECVAGVDGSSTYERSLDGVQLPGSTVVKQAAKDGGTLRLTIDSDLQWYAQQAITDKVQEAQAKWGTVVVVRIKDGHLMAVADYPSVDPNNVNGTKPEDIKSQAFAGVYEPGSTFKAMTAAMLIDAGKISQTTPVTVPPAFHTRGGVITDVFAHGTEHWTTAGVLAQSSNVGISTLTKVLGKQKRYEYLKRFGLGAKTEVDFDGEGSGILHRAEDWDGLTEYAVSFGQGVSATSVQVASIYQTLGNGGVRMPLTLVEGCEQPDGTVTRPSSGKGTRVVSEKAAGDVVEMLENVVTQGPLSPYLTIPGYDIAAKSGTAQVAKQNGIGYGDDRVVSIAGLVKGDDPEYAIVVTLGMPQVGPRVSQVVTGTFTKIAQQVIKTYRITPSPEKPKRLPVEW
jgi:cell division protein FtsI (penicillin-binding protein 3)